MKFIACYIGIHGEDCYYRTIYSDTLTEATKRAERYARKGFIMLSVVQDI